MKVQNNIITKHLKRNKMYLGKWKKEDRDARMYFYYDVILGLTYYSGL
jgi:hypothetical protein